MRTIGRISLYGLGALLLLASLRSDLSAQSSTDCDIYFQTWPGDPVIPGEQCTSVPFLFNQMCKVGSYKCRAICWDCLLGTGTAGQPINLATGDTIISQSDLNLPGLGGGLSLSRTWHSQFPFNEAPTTTGMFGGNWRSNYEESIFVDSNGLAKYSRGSGGIWTLGLVSPTWPASYVMIAPANGNAALLYDATYWTLTFNTGEKRVFSAATGQLLSIVDRNGNTTVMTYDSTNRLSTVTDPAGRHLYFSYLSPTSNLVSGVTTDFGVSLSYGYDPSFRLGTVTKPDLTTVSFQYDSNSMITSVLDTNNRVLEAHTYDSERRGLTSARAGGVDAITINYPFLIVGTLP